jgi:hypothetical protein
MSDKLECETTLGQSRATVTKAPPGKHAPAKPRRKPQTATVTDDLTGRFLRVGNKLYRTSDDKKPIVRLEPDRLVTSNIDALPDILRLAKANGWTSIRVNGGDQFRKAAYFAAAAQGLAVENYSPSKAVQAEADRLRGRLADREEQREAKDRARKTLRPVEDARRRTLLSERFLSQCNEQNARDHELLRAQTLVALAISIARGRYPDDPVTASKDVEAKRQKVATRIANGEKIAPMQVRNQQARRTPELTQNQALRRSGLSR